MLRSKPPVRHPLFSEFAELVPADEIDEGGFRIGVGSDQFARLDGAPVLEPHAGCAPAGIQNLDDRAVVTKIRARGERRGRHRMRQRMRPADRHVVIRAQPDHAHHEAEAVGGVQVRAPFHALAIHGRAQLGRLENLIDQHFRALVHLLRLKPEVKPKLQHPAHDGFAAAPLELHLGRGRAVEHR